MQYAQLHFPFGMDAILGRMQPRWNTREQVSQHSKSPPFSQTSHTSLWSSSFLHAPVSLETLVPILVEERCFPSRGFWSLSEISSAHTSWLAIDSPNDFETSMSYGRLFMNLRLLLFEKNKHNVRLTDDKITLLRCIQMVIVQTFVQQGYWPLPRCVSCGDSTLEPKVISLAVKWHIISIVPRCVTLDMVFS